MPMYDKQCAQCAVIQEDVFEPIGAAVRACACGGQLKRVILPSRRAVIGDEIPGGVLIEHGICHPDGRPKRYYSRSEIRRAADAAGLTNVVRHVTAKGTDKNPYTTKWAGMDAQTLENARILLERASRGS